MFSNRIWRTLSGAATIALALSFASDASAQKRGARKNAGGDGGAAAADGGGGLGAAEKVGGGGGEAKKGGGRPSGAGAGRRVDGGRDGAPGVMEGGAGSNAGAGGKDGGAPRLETGGVGGGKGDSSGTGESTSSAGGIKWLDNMPDALKAANTATKPILVDFFAEWCGPCKMLDSTTFKDEAVIEFVTKNFVAVKIDVDKHKSVFKDYGGSAMPTTFVLKPDGKTIDKFVGYQDGPTYLKSLKGIMAKVGDLNVAAAKAKKLLEDAEAAITLGKYSTAIGLLQQVVEKFASSAEAKTAKDKIRDIEDIAVGKLKEMKDAVQKGDYLVVGKLNSELQDTFAGTQSARDARDVQNALENNVDAKRAMRVAAAKSALDQVAGFVKSERYAMALDMLKKVKKDYPDLKRVADEADWHLDRINSNPMALRKALDEVALGQSKVWLSMARTWKSNGQAIRAKDYYKKVIETFPGTSFAETAKSEMNRGG